MSEHPTTSDISEAIWEESRHFGFRPTVDEQVAISERVRSHARRIPTSASINEAIRSVGLRSPHGLSVAVRNRLARLYPDPPMTSPSSATTPDLLPEKLRAFAGLLEAEWYNGNLDEHAYERLNATLTGIIAKYIVPFRATATTSDLDVAALARALVKVDGTDWPLDHVREVLREYAAILNAVDDPEAIDYCDFDSNDPPPFEEPGAA